MEEREDAGAGKEQSLGLQDGTGWETVANSARDIYDMEQAAANWGWEEEQEKGEVVHKPRETVRRQAREEGEAADAGRG